jgi:diguanylate cyclase (GGDEF)-like protein
MSFLFDIASFERLKATGNLPSPRGAALAIMRATQAEDVSMAELARIAGGDPAFVARIVRAANGLVGYRQRPIVAVQDAILMLGLPAVRNLALGFSLLSNYRRGKGAGFNFDHFWSASLLTAISMQALAQATRRAPADESYTLGLLSRIGKLALATVYPEPYDTLCANLGKYDRDRLVALERERFSTDHRELSAAMLADWGFPKAYCEAVFIHGSQDLSAPELNGRTVAIASTLALARRIAEFCLVTREEQGAQAPSLIEAAMEEGLDKLSLTTLGDRIALDWSGWASLLQMPTRVLAPFEALLEPFTAAPEPEVEPESVAPVASLPETVSTPIRPPVRESSREARLRVLLVETEGSDRQRIREVLESAGHDVQEAETAVLAAELALLVQPHLMIVDSMLPDACGLDLVARLRKIRIGRSIHVLVLMSSQDDQQTVEAFEAGADDCMTKPVNTRVLIAHLRAAQRIASLHREIEQDREEIHNFAAELAVTNRRLQETAAIDALTGFQNRHQFMEQLEQEATTAKRSGRSLSCLAIDVDELAVINDTYGHELGDAALRHVSACLSQGLRGNDVICRAGGDAFLAFCRDTSLDDAVLVAERIRRLVEDGVVSSGRLHLRVTVSIGIAEYGGATATAGALVEAADEALTVARRSGRNRVGGVKKAGAGTASGSG